MTLNWDTFNPPGFTVSPFNTARVTDAQGAFFVTFDFITDPFDPNQQNGADWLFAQEGLATAAELAKYSGERIETELGVNRRFYTRVNTLARQAQEKFQVAFNNVEGQTVTLGPARAAAVSGAKDLWNAYILLAAWFAKNPEDEPPFNAERVQYPSRARGRVFVTRFVRGKPPVSNIPAYVPSQIPNTRIAGIGGAVEIPGNPPPNLGAQTSPDLSGLIDYGQDKPESTSTTSSTPILIGAAAAVGLLFLVARRR